MAIERNQTGNGRYGCDVTMYIIVRSIITIIISFVGIRAAALQGHVAFSAYLDHVLTHV